MKKYERMSDIPEGEIFSFNGKKYELLNHDHSGSLSSGPRCKDVESGEEVFLYYMDWKEDKGPEVT